MREISLLCEHRVLPPAEQFRGFPQTKYRGGTEYGRDALNDTFGECVVAKANEADCGAQTPKSKHVRKGEIAIRVHAVQLL